MENKIDMNDLSPILNSENAHINPSIELISEHIILNGEGHIGPNGALMVDR